jgi:hypothetical protein
MGKIIKVFNIVRPRLKEQTQSETVPVDGSRLRQIAKRQTAENIPNPEKRLSTTQGEPRQPSQEPPEPIDGTKLKRAVATSRSASVPTVVPSAAPVKLGNRSGKADYSGRVCTECEVLSKVVYRYRDSSKRNVELCDKCNAEALERSFGQDDAMEHTGHPSGKADANRPQIRTLKGK